MNFIQEYSLLIAVATPVLVIVAIQVWLFMKGERGTLLLPSLRPFPSVAIEKVVEVHVPIAVPTVVRDSVEEGLAKVGRVAAAERRVAGERRAAFASRVKVARVEEERLENVA